MTSGTTVREVASPGALLTEAGSEPVSWACATVSFAGVRSPAALVDPLPLEVVFTRAERIRSGSGRTVQHWAGRLAAKCAVLRLLGLDPAHRANADLLGEVEILPRPSVFCTRTTACLHGHPPGVRLPAALRDRVETGTRIGVSISHAASTAIAVALASAPLPEDDTDRYGSDEYEDGNER
ncbi:hypothetical protein SAXI111661_08360 [Saccharomonospora xinjiangensis]|uniref:Phosphopantetheinyl transferase (Holo-ACP synthase) n=1 Tax=Saccharomonospora xinjiangensis XJ-54 TaxID=882086 RepID=I0V5I2_9PSEU|nr:hypothetical protein [Saccharomonospora xinjiangensis]EID55385.1 phosphopantetheinyl transferase (holo-ACP synthase) [Saccharomonospora xinjiangensis XJ-54]QBQ61631.1 hypothetical protein EYD13_16430 [Saccharomonospora xinjiangensis]